MLYKDKQTLLRGLIRSPHALEPKFLDILGVQRIRVTDHSRLVVALLVWVHLDVLELEPSRRAVIQVKDDTLRRVSALDVVPAWIGYAGTVGRIGSKGTRKVDEGEVGNACAGFIGVVWTGTFVLIVVAEENVK